MKFIHSLLLKHSVYVNERCSTHIHINFAHRTPEQLYSFLTLYALLESYIYEYAGPDRYSSNFCVPLSQNTDVIQTLVDSFKVLKKGPIARTVNKRAPHMPHIGVDGDVITRELQQTRKLISIDFRSTKYCAISLNRLVDLGTVEIRLFPGAERAEWIIDWCCILRDMYLESVKRTSEDILSLHQQQGMQGVIDYLEEDGVTTAMLLAGSGQEWEALQWGAS